MHSATPRPRAEPPRGPRVSGRVAQADMRAANMGLLLRQLRAHGSRSRARLAHDTGLSKATTSSLVADLAERGLVREGELVRAGGVGRPGQLLSLDGNSVVGIGVGLSVDYATLTAVTLDGTVIRETTTSLDTAHLGVDKVLDRLAMLLRQLLASLSASGVGVVGITIAPPGIIDYASGVLRFAPNLGWRQVPLSWEIARRLEPDAPAIRLENDAKLAAIAHAERYEHRGIRDLLYVAGEVGVGAGIIAGGRLVRGWSGFSGEVGHLPLDPERRQCKCGRIGCWELAIGLNAFLDLATETDDVLRDPSWPIEDRLQVLLGRARSGDPTTIGALGVLGERLSPGLSILADILNPRAIVLGGYYAVFGEFLLPPLEESLAAMRLDAGSGVELATSEMGMMTAARGGALLALEDVFNDPTLITLRGV